MNNIENNRTLYYENYGIDNDYDEVLKELMRETAITQLHYRMLSGAYQGHFLNFIIKTSQAKKILEIGTYTGYSTICMARALPDDGFIHTIEINDEIEWLSKKYFHKANVEHIVKQHIGNAIEIIPKLNTMFDLIFIDADKRDYINYYKTAFHFLKKNGIILVDNVLWNNKIFMPICSNDHMTQGIIAFNEFIKNENNIEKIILPIRDGLMLIRKL